VDDTRLISVSLDGGICEWDITYGDTLADYEDRSTHFVEAVLSPDSESVYVVTGSESLREINLMDEEVFCSIFFWNLIIVRC